MKVDARLLNGPRALALATTVAMVGLLLYTFWHTASLMRRYIEPPFFAYSVAVGIEFGIVALSLRIGQLRKEGDGKAKSAHGLNWVLIGALVVSVLANVAEGYATSHGGELLTVKNALSMDPMQAVIGLAATGVISLLVWAMSGIIGGDVRKVAQAAERAERRAAQAADEATQEVAEPSATIIRLPELPAQPFRCQCGTGFGKQQQLAAHMRRCAVASAQRAQGGKA